MNKDIPVISLQRLPVYLNYLKSLPSDGLYVSSGSIAEALGMGEVLVRKDLAYTSATGRPRVGYLRSELISAIEEYLCCNGTHNAVIVGVGALGRAVLGYGGFSNYGIEIVAAFDSDPKKIGAYIGVEMAVICVPAAHAQKVADVLIEGGVKAILNFAPILIRAPENIAVRHIDVAANLAILSSMI